MKILVTGGAGYIGSVTTEYLIDQGHEVVVVDNLSTGHVEAIDKRVHRFYLADLMDASLLKTIMSTERPDGIIHFAGSIEVGESMTNPGKYFRNNIMMGLNILDAIVCLPIRPKIIFSSTAATYGRPGSLPSPTPVPPAAVSPPTHGNDMSPGTQNATSTSIDSLCASYALSETDAARPASPYGASKWMFEQILEWYWKIYGLPYVVLRYFNAAGASAQFGEDHHPETHLIPRILDVAEGKSPHVYIFGNTYDTPDGTCVRDYIHVLDLADAHLRALTCDHVKTAVLNVGTGHGYSVLEVVESVRRITGHNIPIVYGDARAGDPAVLVANCSAARTALQWRPQHSQIDNIVQTAWQWKLKRRRSKPSVLSSSLSAAAPPT